MALSILALPKRCAAITQPLHHKSGVMEFISSVRCALLVVAAASRASVVISVDCAPDDIDARVQIGVGFSGLGYHGWPPRFYAVSDLGGILMYPYGDGKFVSAVLVYLKTDDKFTPVRSPADYRVRMNWDLAKLKRLRAWVEQQAKARGIELRAKSP